MNNINTSPNNTPAIDLRSAGFSRRIGIVAAVAALAGLTASIPDAMGTTTPVEAIRPTRTFLPGRTNDVWAGTSETRDTNKIEDKALFDWVHRNTPGHRENYGYTQLTYRKPKQFELQVTSQQELLLSTTGLHHHEQWKDVFRLFAPREIKEHNHNLTTLTTTGNPDLAHAVRLLEHQQIKPAANAAWRAAQLFARDKGLELRGFDIELSPAGDAQVTRATITLATDSGTKEFDAREFLQSLPHLKRKTLALSAGVTITLKPIQ